MADIPAQQPMEDVPDIQEGTIQERITAYERQAKRERAHAHAAEEEEQWEDHDYYVDLAEQYDDKANDLRHQASDNEEPRAEASATEPSHC